MRRLVAAGHPRVRAQVPVTPQKAREIGVAGPARQATHFFSDLFGFAWVVPLQGAVNVGMGATVSKGAGLRSRFARFVGQLGLEATRVAGAQIPFLPPRRVWSPRVLLTGDAAGFVDPWTGCGIESGLSASLKAAHVAEQAIARGDFSATQMARYGQLTRNQLSNIRGRGQWIRVADRLTSRGGRFPFWVRPVIKKLVGLDSAPPGQRELGRWVTASAPR